MNSALSPSSSLTQNLSSIISSSCSQIATLSINSKSSSSIHPTTKIQLNLSRSKKNRPFANPSDLHKIPSQPDSSRILSNLETLKEPKSSGYNLNYRHKVFVPNPKTVKILSNNLKGIDELEKNNIFSDKLLENLKVQSFSCLQPKENIGNRSYKRKTRCYHHNEIISEKRYSGILKKYRLKTRYGFIKTQSLKVFLCEDELVLSGVNLRKFKDCVYNKIPIHLEFNLKSFVENGKEILSATQIQVRQDKGNSKSIN
ncbi:hypothetical protein SteCoe_31207 [Stentor coeruleus]|uniref:Uncharacterized protein n=1 Tax=Stentor coeruleus TaxID=5963 RepID=A0A1R2B1V4_9CILI|nr:hypothetical protein SteCoe_31207 [Stentor coeruleus]